MPMKEGREYRMISQPFQAVESDSGMWVEGYATTVDVPYDFGRDGMKECIMKSAFDGADMSDVIFQYDHEGMVMARQRNSTLNLNLDDHGLYIKADLSGCEQGRQLYEAIKSGLVDRMSWAFTVADDGWEYNTETRTSYITKVDKVFDVSAVSIPANENTVINARSYLDGAIEMEQQELLQAQDREARKRLAAKFRMEIGVL